MAERHTPEFYAGQRAFCREGLAENPHDCDTEEFQAWEDGWYWSFQRVAIQWWVDEYYGFYKRFPAVGEAAAAFFTSAEHIAELFGEQPMPGTFRTLTDRALPAQLLVSEGM